jgi:hypothetical protein
MAYQTVTPAKLGRLAIGTSAGTVYQAPAATRTFLKDFDVCNTTAAAQLLTVYIVDTGDVPSTGNALLYLASIPANSTLQWTGNQILHPGDSLQAQASAFGLTIRASGGEAT